MGLSSAFATTRWSLVADAAGRSASVTQRVAAEGTALRIETAGIPADSGWRTALADDPRSVRLGGTP